MSTRPGEPQFYLFDLAYVNMVDAAQEYILLQRFASTWKLPIVYLANLNRIIVIIIKFFKDARNLVRQSVLLWCVSLQSAVYEFELRLAVVK